MSVISSEVSPLTTKPFSRTQESRGATTLPVSQSLENHSQLEVSSLHHNMKRSISPLTMVSQPQQEPRFLSSLPPRRKRIKRETDVSNGLSTDEDDVAALLLSLAAKHSSLETKKKREDEKREREENIKRVHSKRRKRRKKTDPSPHQTCLEGHTS